MDGRSGTETGDNAGTGSMAGTENRAASGCTAETEAAAAVAGWAESAQKVWAVLLLPAALAEVQAAEAGRWVWLGETESESAVGF